MKTTIFSLLLITCISTLSAQNNEKLVASAEFYDAETGPVRIRWSPDKETFYRAKEKGYTVIRYKVKNSGGEALTPMEISNSKAIIADHKKFDTEGISNYLPSDYLAKSLDSLYNHFTIDTNQVSNNRNFKDAIKMSEIEDSKHFYYLLIADMRFDLACKVALGYQERKGDVEPGCTYRYLIIVEKANSHDPDISASTEVTIPTESVDRPNINSFGGHGLNKKAILEWDFEQSTQHYNFYNFYRSDDGGNTFNKINQNPFTYLYDENDNSKIASFQDSLPNNTTTYIYKMEGVSIFEYTSPLTDTIHIKGKPDKMLFELPLDKITFEESNILFNWTSLPASYNDSLVGFDIFVRTSFNDSPVKLNNTIINPTVRTYSLSAPGISAYYYLEAKDPYGYTYQSISILGQNTDTIPPSAPTGLSAEMSKDGTLAIKWDENTENDLDGYMVFYSNNSQGEFTSLTPKPVKSNELVEKLDLSFQLDSLALYVIAVDRRFNKSEPSQIISLARPDVNPPSAPVIRHLYPTAAGIRVGWALPTQEKEVAFELQRRYYQESEWTQVISFKPPTVTFPVPQDTTFDQISDYLDTTQLQIAPYYYRLVASDGAHNKSYSRSVKVTPYDDGVRGLVSDLTGLLMYNSGSSDDPLYVPVQPQNTNNIAPINTNRKVNRAIRLNWEYTTPLPSSLKAFKIYRKTPNGGNLSSPSQRIFTLIATIKAQDAESLALVYSLSGYSYFDKNILPTASGPYEYKIMGLYEDGSMSEYSSSVSILNVP